MSYYIQYDPKLKKRYPSVADKRRRVILSFVLFGVLTVTGVLIRDTIADFLVPGDRSVTVPAFAQLVEKIGAGESVSDSFLMFCRQILSGGAE